MDCPVKEGLREPWFPFHAETSAIGRNAELNEVKIILITVFKSPLDWLRGGLGLVGLVGRSCSRGLHGLR